MKFVELSQGKIAQVCDCHYDLVSGKHWQYHKNGYAVGGQYIEGVHKVLRMHRVINNTPHGKDTDHINGDKLDNRCMNLRTATRTQNNRNSKMRATNKSGHRGVSWDRINNKWVAQIAFNGKNKKLGRFADIQKAVEAYAKASKEAYGDFHV